MLHIADDALHNHLITYILYIISTPPATISITFSYGFLGTFHHYIYFWLCDMKMKSFFLQKCFLYKKDISLTDEL